MEARALTTDPEAKLYKKGNGQATKLSYMGHALIENGHGLVVQADATQAKWHGRTQSGAGDD